MFITPPLIMKVIVAGFCKTGTKSVRAALEEFGYSVYDLADHFWYHRKEWGKIMSCGPGESVDIFKKMYKDRDAVLDLPAFLFWEEIHQAFPDAKIILMTRDEEKFYKSFVAQVNEVKENWLFNFIKMLSPTGWSLQIFYGHCLTIMFGLRRSHSFDFNFVLNEMIVKRAFRHHQRYCKQNAPTDKFLLFDVKEGWGPICQFLGKEVPDKPFPHENIAATIVSKLMATHPALLRIKREAIFMLTLLTGISGFAVYKLIQNGLLDKMRGYLELK